MISIIRVFLISVLLIFLVSFAMAEQNATHCKILQEKGYDVVLIRKTCYASVGNNKYAPIMLGLTDGETTLCESDKCLVVEK